MAQGSITVTGIITTTTAMATDIITGNKQVISQTKQQDQDVATLFYEDINAEEVTAQPMLVEEVKQKNQQQFEEVTDKDMFLF
jgi:hypothetical protein